MTVATIIYLYLIIISQHEQFLQVLFTQAILMFAMLRYYSLL